MISRGGPDRRAWMSRIALGLCLATIAVAAAALECEPLKTTATVGLGDVRRAEGLLWRVRAPDGATSALFGTMHVADPRVTAIPEVVSAELSAAKRFVMEVNLDLTAIAELQTAMFLSGGKRLAQVAGQELFDATAALLEAHGIPVEVATTLKPWAAFITLSLPGAQAALPLDMLLMITAQSAAKEIVGLETVGEQVAVFESIDEADQVLMLREVVCHYGHFQSDIERMIGYYVERNLLAMMELSLQYATEEKQRYLDALLWERNERMLLRLRPILNQGEAFVAVGAMHLPGRRGLLDLLEQSGFSIDRIY